MLFIFACLVLLIGSLLWTASFRLTNKAAWLVGFYLLASTNVVLTLCIANSFLLLNSPWFVLLIHALVGGAGWLAWHRSGYPSLMGAFDGWKPRLHKGWLKKDPVLASFLLLIASAYLFAFIQLILIPQNNLDSLRVHLTRIGFWYQHGSFFPWPAIAFDQLWYPINAQLQTYWTVLFLGSDRLVGMAQWLAAPVSALAIFGIARTFGYGFRSSVFSGLLFLTFPLVVLQSTTTQTDLVTVAFFLPLVYFLLLGLKEKMNSSLLLSAISFGIGLGVKKSYFLFLPVLAIILVIVFLHFGKRSIPMLRHWLVYLVLSTLFLGSYMYVVNWRYFGHPFGSSSYVDSLLQIPETWESTIKVMPSLAVSPSGAALYQSGTGGQLQEYFMELVYNIPRLLYQYIDTSGLPRPIDGYAHKVKLRLTRPIFQWIGFEEIESGAYTAPSHVFSFADKNINEESNAWYGPLSVLLLAPALLFESCRGLRKHSYLLLIPIMALCVFLPLEIILRPGWDPFQGRYFAPVVALAVPLMAGFFEKKMVWREWVIGAFAVMILFVTLLYNPSKPTLGKYSEEFHIWNNDRIFIQTIQSKNERNLYYLIEKNVPADAVLGYYIPGYFLEYPLFGEHFQRQLIPTRSLAQLSDVNWLKQHGLQYILLPSELTVPALPEGYQVLVRTRNWTLYSYTTAP